METPQMPPPPGLGPILPKLPPLDDTLGAILVATFFTVLLQGWTLHQTYQYFREYSTDRWFLKIWVLVVTTLELLSTVCTMHGSYYYMVTHYFDPTILAAPPVWTLESTALLSPLAMLSVELFFARRLWIVGPKQRFIAVAVIVLDIVAFACGIVSFIFEVRRTAVSNLMNTNIATSSIVMDLASDLLLTTTLIYILNKSRTGIQETSSIVDALIKYAVGTGLLVFVCNLVFVITTRIYLENLIPGAIGIVMTKVYAVTFLVGLNARRSLLTPDDIKREQSFQLTSIGGWRVDSSTGNAARSTLSHSGDTHTHTHMRETGSTFRKPRIPVDDAHAVGSIAIELRSVEFESESVLNRDGAGLGGAQEHGVDGTSDQPLAGKVGDLPV
ncbi:hypothetical protein C8Q76DRAFT_859648 [Earliella scabrosa]|nr:hypothetical protein C8Q76DRAFT_859648 [Earliella scabrosa]